MAYGLNPGLFLENGPAVQAANARAAHPASRFASWRRLSSDRRLALVDQALARAANDLDAFPLAL
jgi:hypothetical protein